MDKARALLALVLDWLISICLTGAAVLAFVEVVLRYIFGSSLSWSFEVLLILLTYMSFLGAALALEKGGHLKVLVLAKKLPRKLQIAAFFINLAAVGLTTTVMLIWGTLFTLRFHESVTDVLLIPVSWIYVVIPFSGAIMTLQVMADMVAGIMRLSRGEQLEFEGAEVGDI